jgi:hypothetical protein
MGDEERVYTLWAVVIDALKVPRKSLELVSCAASQDGTTRAVFKVRQKTGSFAVKCFLYPDQQQDKSRLRVSREVRMASWGSTCGIGAPVLSVLDRGNAKFLCMQLASGTLEDLLKIRTQLPFATVKDVCSKAFRLIRDERLTSRGLVCADLKPANILLFSKGNPCDLKTLLRKGVGGVDVKLSDFDPFFWSQVEPDHTRCLNSFFFLANSLPWAGLRNLLVYLPEEAARFAEAMGREDLDIVSVVTQYPDLLQKGPLHYASRSSPGENSLWTILRMISDVTGLVHS